MQSCTELLRHRKPRGNKKNTVVHTAALGLQPPSRVCMRAGNRRTLCHEMPMEHAAQGMPWGLPDQHRRKLASPHPHQNQQPKGLGHKPKPTKPILRLGMYSMGGCVWSGITISDKDKYYCGGQTPVGGPTTKSKVPTEVKMGLPSAPWWVDAWPMQDW